MRDISKHVYIAVTYVTKHMRVRHAPAAATASKKSPRLRRGPVNETAVPVSLSRYFTMGSLPRRVVRNTREIHGSKSSNKEIQDCVSLCVILAQADRN